ncbi:lipase maturation factor family protein [Streptomyces sp. TLI_171]|uniref:lipase maturation factor family protein n=1 Tax=Streptomyces sp. TLI_171 TaxID=1938859 RepID=UPI000C18619D|nr:lipase maturation factor family protein [Streptomyces sp. TLI_171]RKE22319.1 lipase maturation factor [Streptomyces sp. TLI_171]
MAWFAAPEYRLARQSFLRLLALVYLCGFLAAARQFRALLGSRGMLPIPRYTARVPFRRAPSLFHWRYSDRLYAAHAWTGAALAAALLAGLADHLPLGAATALWAAAWALYLSIVNVGQTWYAFGWESLLLEAGAIAVFLGNAATAPPLPGLWLLRWLLFRVEFGAGLIKWRGDECWRKLTCLYHHHETQPMPGPLSWAFHHLPRPLHKAEAAANHLVQLVVPFGLFLPQPIASWAALLMIATQLWLIASGNFAWLNWLTVALAVGVLDTGTLRHVLPIAPDPAYPPQPVWYQALVAAFVLLVAVRSWRPVRNLLSRRQQMNRSYDPLHLVNTYGAFGSVNRVRYEIVLEGTRDVHGADGWQEYEFHGKPGELRRLPRQFAPYHLRLDWLMWFAAISPSYARPWFLPLLARLLVNDPDTLRLLRRNPFPDTPPALVRARLHRYRFTDGPELAATGAWWHRRPVRDYQRPVGLADLRHLVPGTPGARR